MTALKTLSFLALATVACSTAVAQSDATSAIRAYYAKGDALMMRMDFAGLQKLTQNSSTSDYVMMSVPDKSGKVMKHTLAEESQNIPKFAAMFQTANKCVAKVVSVTVNHNTAVALVNSDRELTTKKLGDGKTHLMMVATESQTTWVKTGGRWKIKITKTLKQKMTVDGHAVPGT